MQKKESGYEAIKANFLRAENLLKSGKSMPNMEEAWIILFQDNEEYYKHVYAKKYRMYNDGGTYDDSEFYDCFNDTIMSVLRNFDPEKGNLENYFNRIWGYRVEDKGIEFQKNAEEFISLNEDFNDGEDGGTQKREIAVEQSELKEKESEEKLSEILIEILSAINHLNEHRGRKNSKKNYFKMFFTDNITLLCKNYEINKSMEKKEHTIMAGLDLSFLDFYMKERCRNFQKIQVTPLKSMKEIKGKGTEDEIKLPLENQIYLIYLGLSSSGGVTQMQTKYRNFCEQLNIKKKLLEL